MCEVYFTTRNCGFKHTIIRRSGQSRNNCKCAKLIMGNKGIYSTVDAGYKNTSYKNMPVIRTLTRFTESFVFYSIDSLPVIRTLYWKTVAIYPI